MRVAVVGSVNMDLVVGVSRLPAAGRNGHRRQSGAAPRRQGRQPGRRPRPARRRGHADRSRRSRQLRPHPHPPPARRGRLDALGPGQRTGHGRALIEVDERGENSIAVAPGANLDLLPEDVPRRPFAAADVVMAPLEVPIPSIEEAFRLGLGWRADGAERGPRAADLRPPCLRLTDVVIVNEHELGVLLEQSVPIGAEVEAARALQPGARARRADPRRHPGPPGRLRPDRRRAGAAPGLSSSSRSTPSARGTPSSAASCGGAGSRAGGLADALRLGCAAGALAATQRGAQAALPTYAAVRHLIDR